MKSTTVLLFSTLLSVGVHAAPHGWEHESTSIAPVPTTDCETATWVPYDYDSETSVPYEPYQPEQTTAVYEPSSEPVHPPGPYEPTPSSEAVWTPAPSGYDDGYVPYESEEPTTTLTSTIESTVTYVDEVSIYPSSEPVYIPVPYEPYPYEPSSEPVYTPTPYPYPIDTPVPSYETPSPVPYPTPAYYPPGNETYPSGVPGNDSYPTPPYVPPYEGSASVIVINNGGVVQIVAGLVSMVAIMGVF